jgi:alcohol dehydrogenase (NADP+)
MKELRIKMRCSNFAMQKMERGPAAASSSARFNTQALRRARNTHNLPARHKRTPTTMAASTAAPRLAPTRALHTGAPMPILGLGTWKSAPGAVRAAVVAAIESGYRAVDCAAAYGNEGEVGSALKEVIERGIVRREELFLTSKLWVSAAHPGTGSVAAAIDKTLADLGTPYLDLYLVHWPFAIDPTCPWPPPPEQVIPFSVERNGAVWRELEAAVDAGKIKALGVSNLSASKLEALMAVARIKPAVNQVECHPFLPQKKLLSFAAANGILVTAYSPLGSPDRPARLMKETHPVPLQHPTILKIAEETKLSPAQLLIKWQLQRGLVVIPKSVTPSRIAENFESAFAPDLSAEAMEAIGSLELQNDEGRIFPGYQTVGQTVEDFWA